MLDPSGGNFPHKQRMPEDGSRGGFSRFLSGPGESGRRRAESREQGRAGGRTDGQGRGQGTGGDLRASWGVGRSSAGLPSGELRVRVPPGIQPRNPPQFGVLTAKLQMCDVRRQGSGHA